MHGYVVWSLDSDLYLATFYFKNPDFNFIANRYGFTWFSGEYEHGFSPSLAWVMPRFL